MSEETFETWIPIPELKKPADSASLTWGNSGLRIVLKDRDRSFELVFSTAYAVRDVDEGHRLATLRRLPDPVPPFLIVGNSEWLEWFHRESLGILRGMEIRHYCILTSEDVIDVLSGVPPTCAER